MIFPKTIHSKPREKNKKDKSKVKATALPPSAHYGAPLTLPSNYAQNHATSGIAIGIISEITGKKMDFRLSKGTTPIIPTPFGIRTLSQGPDLLANPFSPFRGRKSSGDSESLKPSLKELFQAHFRFCLDGQICTAKEAVHPKEGILSTSMAGADAK
ncbi:MAG: hypothetical protein CMM01_23850 [Rhodopirellula sp.]|nr:hypothetical protein [Rhodopirellula sp.]